MLRANEYAARLFLQALNERFARAFRVEGLDSGLWRAVDEGGERFVVAVNELFEADEAWLQRREELEQRLDEARPGSYLLWVPPGGELPAEEPEESEWVRRVVLAASKLASGRSGEVRLPAKLALGKIKDEGGYASVTGGLGRFWTNISAHLQGSFYLDSRGLNRFTKNEEEREQLFEEIGLVSQGLVTGDVAEFEHEDAWTLQRLPRVAATEGMSDGWAITGCPPSFDPNDGSAVRRLLRRRLAEAGPALTEVRDAMRALVLVGAYDYIDNENVGPSLRGFDPALTASFDAIGLVTDGEVRPIRVPAALQRGIGGAS